MNAVERLQAKLLECYELEEWLAEVRRDLVRIQQEPEYRDEMAGRDSQQLRLLDFRLAKAMGTAVGRAQAEAAVARENAEA